MATAHPVKHHFPSSIISWVEDSSSMSGISHFTDSIPRADDYSHRDSYLSRNLHDMHVSDRLIEEFMELAKENTSSNLETCGILGASFVILLFILSIPNCNGVLCTYIRLAVVFNVIFLYWVFCWLAFLSYQNSGIIEKDGTYYVTTLVVPKQETTAHSCQASNEEEIHATLAEQSLIPGGWIHVMLPEAVAIVIAPTDPTRQYGIFRLTDPGGVTVLRECKESGFHQHAETSDGSPIYESCSNVYFRPTLRFEIVDLRSS